MVDSEALGQSLQYELGVVRSFGTSDIGVEGLVSGWSAPEEGHVWNDGPEACLLITTTPFAEPCRITVGAAPFIRDRHPRQEATLYVNGARLGFWRFHAPEQQTMTSVLHPEHAIVRGKQALLQFAWHLPLSVQPSEIGSGKDDRELALSFLTIGISPIRKRA